MNQVRSKQRLYMISLIVVILGFIGLSILLLTTAWSVDLKMTLFLVLMIVLMLVTFWFRPRIYYYNKLVGFYKLKQHAAKPVPTKHELLSERWANHLSKKGFRFSRDYGTFILMHRLIKDERIYTARQVMLEIVVFMKNPDLSFQSPDIVQAVNDLEHEYRQNKTSFRHYSIIQVKAGETFDENIQAEVDQVTFDNHGRQHIHVLNAYYIKSTGEVYFLHSDIYYPTAYYQYIVNLFKSLI